MSEMYDEWREQDVRERCQDPVKWFFVGPDRKLVEQGQEIIKRIVDIAEKAGIAKEEFRALAQISDQIDKEKHATGQWLDKMLGGLRREYLRKLRENPDALLIPRFKRGLEYSI